MIHDHMIQDIVKHYLQLSLNSVLMRLNLVNVEMSTFHVKSINFNSSGQNAIIGNYTIIAQFNQPMNT